MKRRRAEEGKTHRDPSDWNSFFYVDW
jgi:hypothetical protein